MYITEKMVVLSDQVRQSVADHFDPEKYDVFIDIPTRRVVAIEKNTIVDASIPLETSFVLPHKLAVLPTPNWVKSEQKYYVCFASEVPRLMKQFWEAYLEH